MRPLIRKGSFLLIAAASIVGCSCGGDEPTSEPLAVVPTDLAPADEIAPIVEPVVGGITWRAPEPLVYTRTDNPMRAVEYTVRDHDDATLAVSHFAAPEGGGGGGGGVQANIDRWLGQFEPPEGGSTAEASEITIREVNGLRVTVVDVRGRFVGRLGMGGPSGAHEGWRLLGAIAEGPEGPVFFKLIGAEDAVVSAEDAFEGLVTSIRREGA